MEGKREGVLGVGGGCMYVGGMGKGGRGKSEEGVKGGEREGERQRERDRERRKVKGEGQRENLNILFSKDIFVVLVHLDLSNK